MWDLELFFINFFFFINFKFHYFVFQILNLFDPYLHNGLFLTNFKIFYQFSQNTSFFFAIKFLISISFLILVRGGTPRYRYDYLTKLGWLRFIGLVIFIFFISLLNFFVF